MSEIPLIKISTDKQTVIKLLFLLQPLLSANKLAQLIILVFFPPAIRRLTPIFQVYHLTFQSLAVVHLIHKKRGFGEKGFLTLVVKQDVVGV